MGDLARKESASSRHSIQKLLAEISLLEKNIGMVSKEIGTFENSIRHKLQIQISQLSSLNKKMKEKQQLKKAKRLEQKKKGKNYKEPVQLISPKQKSKSGPEVNEGEKQELKRLYKEAIVKVHPDKIDHGGMVDKIKTATDLTSQLNGIYKNGDLEALLNFYQTFIIALPDLEGRQIEIPSVNSEIRLVALLSKKEALTKQLQNLEANYLYHVLKTYENPLTFIDELELEFQNKIGKLEKRTRKGFT